MAMVTQDISNISEAAMTSPSLTGTVLKEKWKLGALLGKGACANVYEATDVSAGAVLESGEYVAKVVPPTASEHERNSVFWENTLYQGYLRPLRALRHTVEIPLYGFGEDRGLLYLVMTRLGPNIQAAKEKSHPWSLSEMTGYAQQMFQLLRSLHEKCKLVFVDIKPENFCFGLPGSDDKDKIFLIDFGISDTCDDLEALGYVIVSLLKRGSSDLPWSGATSVSHGLDMKRNTSLESLCRDCPEGMLKYMKIVRRLGYAETPQYDKLYEALGTMGTTTSAGSGGAKGQKKRPKGTNLAECSRKAGEASSLSAVSVTVKFSPNGKKMSWI